MEQPLDPQRCKRAKAPHELFMLALAGQLLLGPAAIFIDVGPAGLFLPLGFSLLFFLYTLWRANRSSLSGDWLVAVHWRFALRRYRLLYIGYGITAIVFAISLLLGQQIDPRSPQHFLPVALLRIGVMPTIIMLFVCLVLENGALSLAQQGKVPDTLARRYPPPAP